MSALFDRKAATQGWKIPARVLREYVEFFGSKTEQLDLLARDDKAIFTSYTERIQDGKGETRREGAYHERPTNDDAEVLKQPLETAITIHITDFDDFHMRENVHIVINVKDFRAIVTHAETLRAQIACDFSYASRPLLLSYRVAGIHCEFTLMTTGNLQGASAASSPTFVTTRGASCQSSVALLSAIDRSAAKTAAPRVLAAAKPPQSRSGVGRLGTAQQRQISEEGEPSDRLFVRAADDDQTWDPPNFDQDQEDEMLGWDASVENPSASFHPTFRDTGGIAAPARRGQGLDSPATEGLQPTQRLSQVSFRVHRGSPRRFANACSSAVCLIEAQASQTLVTLAGLALALEFEQSLLHIQQKR